ncbi:hypothetical protein [Bacillus pseudomycoides]|uniref:hypothetical protein n=1 Tax=Bacillus pseudomycoides TaxID=64104 RepID=UPI00159BD94C|nr:hypothetical protein [Bacillus pseudomycoides]
MQRAKQLGPVEYDMIAGEFEDISTGSNGPGSCIIGMSGIVGQVFTVYCYS